MPHALIAQTIRDNYVASHTFRFITPAVTETSKVPNLCTSCHKERDDAWATKELTKWKTTSPWRMTQPLM